MADEGPEEGGVALDNRAERQRDFLAPHRAIEFHEQRIAGHAHRGRLGFGPIYGEDERVGVGGRGGLQEDAVKPRVEPR